MFYEDFEFLRQPPKQNVEKIVQLETSKFEDYKKEAISFVQDSVKTCYCYFPVPQKQPFKSVS